MPSVPLALGPIRWPNSSKAGALSLNIGESVGYQNEIVIATVIVLHESGLTGIPGRQATTTHSNMLEHSTPG
jgi:hypothetical protein